MRQVIVLIALIAAASAVSAAAPSIEVFDTDALARTAAHKLFPHLVAAPKPRTLSAVPVRVQDALADCSAQIQEQVQSTLGGSDCQALMQADESFGDNPTPAQVSQALTGLCSSACYRPFTEVMSAYAQCIQRAGITGGGASFDLFDTMTKFIEFMCTKNEAGEYCMVGFSTPAIEHRNINNASACDAFTSYGCCSTSLINMYSEQVGTWDQVFRFCGMANTPACPRPNVEYKVIVVKVRIAGVAYNWIAQASANRAVATVALKQDLARLFNVSTGSIQVVGLSAGSLIANLNVRGSNDAATETMQSSVNAAIANPSVTFTALSTALPADAKTGALTLDVSASSATTETQINQAGAASVRAVVWSAGAIIATAVAVFALAL